METAINKAMEASGRHEGGGLYGEFGEDAFSRFDESDDSAFYERERFVSHLDAVALSTVEAVIGGLVPEKNVEILDLMASWDSHLPSSLHPARVSAIGLNENELMKNNALTDYIIQDVNKNPVLPYPDESFDAVINTVSVDYIVKPIEIFKEVARVLRPGGLFLVIFSNRMFHAKAVRIWQELSERERPDLVRRYFEATEAFDAPELFVGSGAPRPREDKYAHLGIPSDPVYALYANRKGGSGMKRPEIHLPGALRPEGGAINGLRKQDDDGLCPHCGKRMKKWKIPNNPFSTWDAEMLYICFNNECPYLCRGWQVMTDQGNSGMSYRYVYDPVRRSSIPLPIMNLYAGLDELTD
ncbi:MAG: class I SAM-dependent methyltransferase [Syntrophobacteraceae bacterium]